MEPIQTCSEPKEPGDIVMIGPHLGPKYLIVHIDNGLAWVRPFANGTEGITPVSILKLVRKK